MPNPPTSKGLPAKVSLGRVARAHGVRGRVEIRPGGEALAPGARVWIGGEAREIADASPAVRGWLVEIAGVASREAAEAMKGREVEVERAALPPAGPGEFYAADLVGCAVVGEGGETLGTVAGVMEVRGAPDLLVVARPGGREALLPVVKGVVVGVDLPRREVAVRPPDGLLDL